MWSVVNEGLSHSVLPLSTKIWGRACDMMRTVDLVRLVQRNQKWSSYFFITSSIAHIAECIGLTYLILLLHYYVGDVAIAGFSKCKFTWWTMDWTTVNLYFQIFIFFFSITSNFHLRSHTRSYSTSISKGIPVVPLKMVSEFQVGTCNTIGIDNPSHRFNQFKLTSWNSSEARSKITIFVEFDQHSSKPFI